MEYYIQNLHKALNLAKEKKRENLFVFDLDSTLFCMKYRTEAIIKSSLKNPDFQKNFFQYIERIKKIEVTNRDWSIEEILTRYGFSPGEQIVTHLQKLWSNRFFTNNYLHLDKPYKGCVQFVNKVYEYGTEVIYLTAPQPPKDA